jgi:hypothetical protein
MQDTAHDRVYSEEEIGRILKEAASLQDREGTRPTTGLSLIELQQLARDTGIDPRHVESAALALADRSDQDTGTLLGGPLQMTMRRRIKGSVSQETFARMVSEARRMLRRTGTTSEAGAIREWSAPSQIGASTSLTLREFDDHTDIEIFWTESQLLPIPFIAVPVIGIVVWLGIILNDMALTGLTAAAAIATMLLLYTLSPLLVFRSITRNQRRTIRKLTDRVTDLAQEAVSSEPAKLSTHESEGPLISFDAEPPEQVPSRSVRERSH